MATRRRRAAPSGGPKPDSVATPTAKAGRRLDPLIMVCIVATIGFTVFALADPSPETLVCLAVGALALGAHSFWQLRRRWLEDGTGVAGKFLGILVGLMLLSMLGAAVPVVRILSYYL